MKKIEPVIIVYAEDDPDDRLLVQEALEESKLLNKLVFVENGEELLDYLYRRGKFQNCEDEKLPGLILLDLNMPRKDGREVLKEIKKEQKFRRIPVVVLTTSREEEDILRTYDLGANSFIKKPVTFESLVEIVKTIGTYWFEIVELPKEKH